MKYIKMLGLLAVAAAALMAFAGAASATTITSPTGTLYTGTIEAESSHGVLHNKTLGVSTTCTESKVIGEVKSHGPSVTAKGPISTLSFDKCGTSHVTVVNKGELEIHSDGSLTSTGAEVSILNTSVGITCVYTTSNTNIGTLTDSHDTGGHAVLDIKSSIIPRTGGSGFCGSSGEWTGTYTVTKPSTLYID